MRTISLAAALIVSAAVSVLTGSTGSALAKTASACKINDLPCWGSGKKCNIKFLKQTGKGSGAGGSKYSQVSWAVTIKVLAIKPDGRRAGGNSLTIPAGQSGTLNMDKKKGFDRIKIYTTTARKGTMKIPCADIQAILKADKNCRIFTHLYEGESSFYYLAYNCGVADGRSENFFWVF